MNVRHNVEKKKYGKQIGHFVRKNDEQPGFKVKSEADINSLCFLIKFSCSSHSSGDLLSKMRFLSERTRLIAVDN